MGGNTKLSLISKLTRSFSHLLILIAVLVTPTVTAQKEKLSVSSPNHPKAYFYWPLISQVYNSLGFDIEIVSMPSGRGLKELEKGMFQADVARLSYAIDTRESLIKLTPPLGNAILYLLCNKKVTCDIDTAMSEQNRVFAAKGTKHLTESLDLKFNFATIENAATLLQMLKIDRIDYLIYLEHEDTLPLFKEKFNLVQLGKVTIHHTIHKSIGHLESDISNQLTNLLPKFKEKYKYSLSNIID
ncbi:hypothetical protein C7Y70_11040 [Pseudoalteromonas sp. KS88]|uniref:hypothetical protein n=1 Tax=Pseudoalteromonas sp. KS88 TaxID=2109918 RepID=UPI001080BC8C|nr:hypothetical protein [Pseudoalteromonas sp. KS88]TGE83221.1 hypothetical protein C7Y70_11040 [Pseudoalteromonas sp. KS88]